MSKDEPLDAKYYDVSVSLSKDDIVTDDVQKAIDWWTDDNPLTDLLNQKMRRAAADMGKAMADAIWGDPLFTRLRGSSEAVDQKSGRPGRTIIEEVCTPKK